jgi:hypothetical protein
MCRLKLSKLKEGRGMYGHFVSRCGAMQATVGGTGETLGAGTGDEDGGADDDDDDGGSRPVMEDSSELDEEHFYGCPSLAEVMEAEDAPLLLRPNLEVGNQVGALGNDVCGAEGEGRCGNLNKVVKPVPGFCHTLDR